MHTIAQSGTAPGPLRRRPGTPLGLPPGLTLSRSGRPPGLRLGSGLLAALGRLLDRLFAWQDRAAQRAALARMDERMLKDIGLSRAQALEEAHRPFWQA